MKGSIAVSQIILIIIAIFAGTSILFPLSAVAGDGETQKSLYVAHELAFLLRASALMPEDSSYLLPDLIEGASAKSVQGKLVVSTDFDRSPDIVLPEDIIFTDNEVPVDFLYVTKNDKILSLSSIRTDACLKIESGGTIGKTINVNTLPKFDAEEKLLNDAATAISNKLSNVKKMKIEGDSTLLYTKKGAVEGISVNPSANRKHSTIACYISSELGLPLSYSDEPEGVVIIVSENTDLNDLSNKVVSAVGSYYE